MQPQNDQTGPAQAEVGDGKAAAGGDGEHGAGADAPLTAGVAGSATAGTDGPGDAKAMGTSTAKVLPPEGRPKTPPSQPGDPVPEVAKPVAQPKLQSLDEGKAELDANPGRHSVLTDQGHLTR